jgi:hypothetical protein
MFVRESLRLVIPLIRSKHGRWWTAFRYFGALLLPTVRWMAYMARSPALLSRSTLFTVPKAIGIMCLPSDTALAPDYDASQCQL